MYTTFAVLLMGVTLHLQEGNVLGFRSLPTLCATYCGALISYPQRPSFSWVFFVGVNVQSNSFTSYIQSYTFLSVLVNGVGGGLGFLLHPLYEVFQN